MSLTEWERGEFGRITAALRRDDQRFARSATEMADHRERRTIIVFLVVPLALGLALIEIGSQLTIGPATVVGVGLTGAFPLPALALLHVPPTWKQRACGHWRRPRSAGTEP
jgi:hypothetical protein